MAHKTLIGGTAYEISGGKTLVGGTAYEIDKGKTLVGGTAYEVGFGKPVTITLKRHSMYSGTVAHSWIEINGIPYYAAETPTEITVTEGTKIVCRAVSQIQLNGKVVAQGNGNVSYEYTASVNATIEAMSTHNSDTQYLGLILITEQ